MQPSVRITYTPLRHGQYHVQAHDSNGQQVAIRAHVPGSRLRETIERMAEDYADAWTQPIPQDLRTWS